MTLYPRWDHLPYFWRNCFPTLPRKILVVPPSPSYSQTACAPCFPNQSKKLRNWIPQALFPEVKTQFDAIYKSSIAMRRVTDASSIFVEVLHIRLFLCHDDGVRIYIQSARLRKGAISNLQHGHARRRPGATQRATSTRLRCVATQRNAGPFPFKQRHLRVAK